MSKSLQDQLLGAGLVDQKKAKKMSKDARKERNQKRRNKDTSLTESQQAVKANQEEKQQRDKELNAERKAEADKKALAAQIAQLVQHYRVKDTKGDHEYNFSDDSKIKKMYLSDETADALSRGRLCIVRVGTSYEVVPKPIVDRIKTRDESVIVVANCDNTQKSEAEQNEDDAYYAQFEIPDDLMW